MAIDAKLFNSFLELSSHAPAVLSAQPNNDLDTRLAIGAFNVGGGGGV